MSGLTYRGLLTTAAAIKGSKWKIESPMEWEILDTEQAKSFIKTVPTKNGSTDREGNYFKILLVQPLDRSGNRDIERNELFDCPEILEAAWEANWIGSSFRYYIEMGVMGPIVSVEVGGSVNSGSALHTRVIAQTPKDTLPFVSIVVTRLNDGKQPGGVSWVCLVFADPDMDLDGSIANLSDFDIHILPHFMVLPTCLVQWQLEHTINELDYLKERIVAQDEKMNEKAPLTPLDTIKKLKEIRNQVFKSEKEHHVLRRRWLFQQDLTEKLLEHFQTIKMRKGFDDAVIYPRQLCYNVRIRSNQSSILQYDLDTALEKIKLQHAEIDRNINDMIALNSCIAADAARRDSSFMKTVTIFTLLFLPGTFVAALYSMSMFTWEADGSLVMSPHVGMYIVIATPLVLALFTIWAIWAIWGGRSRRNPDANLRLQKLSTK
ncbi:hypothetical protein TWF696_002013 [Orbilia brochopaga]|uniref:Uncharacterized protein n=1 Tax=Orbilia brochopaga TaxID=3140254 RepID=A0AAV9U6K0_9PEZI